MDNTRMSFFDFCDKLISDGAYQGDDGHIYRKDGRALSRQCRNGDYVVRKRYDGNQYHFMEHRVVYYFRKGKFDETLQINHKDFDRTNNRIENLEPLTAKDNVNYSKNAGRMDFPVGVKNGNSMFEEKEVQFIRSLKKDGWSTNVIRELFDNKMTKTTVSRIVTGARYGSVQDASTIMSIYPLIVEKTSRKDLSYVEEIQNAVLGIAGESGELVDCVKKYLYHGHDIDVIHVMLELGDILYYICWLCLQFDIDFSEIMFANMEKLENRYPDGFEVDKSLHRAEGDI